MKQEQTDGIVSCYGGKGEFGREYKNGMCLACGGVAESGFRPLHKY